MRYHTIVHFLFVFGLSMGFLLIFGHLIEGQYSRIIKGCNQLVRRHYWYALHGVRTARWLVGLSSNATNNSDVSSLCTLTL